MSKSVIMFMYCIFFMFIKGLTFIIFYFLKSELNYDEQVENVSHMLSSQSKLDFFNWLKKSIEKC